EYVQLFTEKAGMLRRVPAADDDLPLVRTYAHRFTVLQAPVTFRQGSDVLAEHAEHLLVVGHRLRREARGIVEADSCIGCRSPCIRNQDAAQQVFFTRHPQLYIALLRQPAGTAGVIRMKVRHEHPAERTAL